MAGITWLAWKVYQRRSTGRILAAQLFRNFVNVIVLKEADGGDAGGSCGKTGMGIRECDPSQGQHWDVRQACFLQKLEARGRCVFLFEDRGEDGERCGVGGSAGYFCWRVTGDSDHGISW